MKPKKTFKQLADESKLRPAYWHEAIELIETDKDQQDLAIKLASMAQTLADYENAAKMTMDEKCTANEVHCACVPLLRTMVKEKRNNNLVMELCTLNRKYNQRRKNS